MGDGFLFFSVLVGGGRDRWSPVFFLSLDVNEGRMICGWVKKNFYAM